uniref:Ion_trans domain-containing protein n=1 Tax=Macrostomum lignano TaxID=282301 RepID=A0A1I8GFZ4_9PLAT
IRVSCELLRVGLIQHRWLQLQPSGSLIGGPQFSSHVTMLQQPIRGGPGPGQINADKIRHLPGLEERLRLLGEVGLGAQTGRLRHRISSCSFGRRQSSPSSGADRRNAWATEAASCPPALSPHRPMRCGSTLKSAAESNIARVAARLSSKAAGNRCSMDKRNCSTIRGFWSPSHNGAGAGKLFFNRVQPARVFNSRHNGAESSLTELFHVENCSSMDPLSLLNQSMDSEISAGVREILSANLRHCIRLNKLAKLKLLVAKVTKETVNWQACLILAINEKRPAIVSYLVQEQQVRLPFYHWDAETCGCSVCKSISKDIRCYQVYALEVFPCAVAPLYVYSLDEDPMAYCLRMAARLASVRLSLASQNMVKAYKQSKRNIGACLSLVLDQTGSDREAQQLLLDDVEEDLIECVDRYSQHLGRALMFAQFRLNKAVVHRATQTVIEAQFSLGSEILGDMWSVIGFVKMLFVCAFAFAVLTPISIIFPHPRLIKFLRSARILALMEVVSIVTYLIAVFVGANISSSSDVRSIICFNSSDTYMQLQTFCLAFIIARIIDEAYNLSLMSGRQFYLEPRAALHFSSLLFLIIWFETAKRYTSEMPSFRQSLCSANRSAISLCDILTILQPHELTTLQLLMEPVFYVNSVTGFGNLFLYTSLVNVFVWQKTMGVLALTVQSMMKDVLKFVSVLFIVFIAYTTAMTNSYRNFVCGTSGFGKTFSTVAIQFFWAMFGMTNSDDNELKDAGDTWTQYFDPLMAVKFALLI